MAIAVLHESALDDAGAPAREVSQADRRSVTRLSVEDASWLRSARLKYGPDVRVIDVSAGGILVESEGTPLAPHSNVVFELTSPTGTTLVPSRVLRSQPVDGEIGRYRTACAFKRPLPIDTLAAASTASPAPAAPRATWQRVVARFRNGKVVRGYTNDFHPSKAHLHLTPEDRTGEPLFVALSQLKAVFFVREFAGDPARVDRTDLANARHGRKVEVAFEDGEVLVGTTLAYRADGGFFVQPADDESNNMRVFVSPSATLHVRVL